MTEKKRSSGSENKTELSRNVSKRPNEAKLKKKQREKRRLFNTLRYQVGIPPTLALILPSLAKASDDTSNDLGIAESDAHSQKTVNSQENTQEVESAPSSNVSNEHHELVAESEKKEIEQKHVLPSARLALHHYPMHAYTSHHIVDRPDVITPFVVSTDTIEQPEKEHKPNSSNEKLEQTDTEHPPVLSTEKNEHRDKGSKSRHHNSEPQLSEQSHDVKEDDVVFHGQMVATDADGDTLTYAISTPIDGLSFNSDGSYSFDPSHASYQHLAQGQMDVIQTTVTVTDSAGGTHSEVLQFQITGTNDVAKITGQFSGTLTEDHNVDSSGLMHVHGKVDVVDVDQGESHTLSEVLQGKFGVLDIDSDGHWHYQVDNSLPAIQQLSSGNSITEQIAIHTVDGTSQLIEIVIGGTSDSAIISGIDSGSVKEDLNVVNGSVKTSGDLSISDSDQGQNHFLSQALIGKFGTLTIDANGHWQYEANNQQTALQELAKGSHLNESFTVSSVDGTHHNVDIQIDGTNDLPMMAGQSQSVKEDGAVFHGQMVATDVDHDLLTYSISNPVDGLTFNPDGSYTFDPSHASYQHLAKGDTQVVTTKVTVTDSAGGSHREELKFTITGTNDLPVMAGQSQSVKEDGAVFHGQMVATDVDHDLLTYTTSHPIDGLTFNPDGSYTFDPSHASYQHLAKGDTQVVTTTVTVTDTAGGSHREELKFTITGTNDLPVMAGQSQSVKEDGAVFHGQMVATDVDQDLLTYSVSHPIDGLTFNPDGSYSFDPSHASYQHLAKGDTQVVTSMVTVTDTAGGAHREELKFTITGTNDLPVMAGQSQSVKEDGAVFQGQMVATDVDHDLLTYSTSHPIDGLTFNPDGSYTFDPSHASYQYLAKGDTQVVNTMVTVTDSAGGSHREELKFTISGTNDLPVMAGQSQSVKEDGAVFQGQMVATDVDHDLLTYSTSHPIDGLTFNPDGSYTFDPSHASYQHLAKGDTQVVTTMVTVTDTAGGSHREELKFTITGTNDLPVMAGQSQSVKEDGAVFHGQMVATDVDHDLLTYSISNPIDGLTFNPDGSYTFYPRHASYQHIGSGDSEVVKTVVTVTDSAGGQSQQELSFTVHGTNDAPNVSSSVTLPTGDEDKPYLIQASSLLSNVTDVDTNDLGKLMVANLEALKPDSTPAGTITDNHDGTFTYTPEANYNGSVHFYYQVKDAHGGVMLDHASTSLNAVADNAQISYAATDQHHSGVTEDRGYIDTHDKLHFEGKLDIVDPDKGEAEFDINYGPQTYTGIGYDTKLGGHILLMRDGRYVYTIRDHQPQVQSLNEGEVLTDQCVVRAKDGTTFTIEVNIHGTNDAPTLSAQTQSVVEDGSRLTGQMQGQDIDHGATLKYSIAHAVDGLTFNTDGSYSFDPSHASYQQLKDGEHKVITIPVTVTDEHGASSTQNLTINLQGKGDAAVIGGVDTGDVYENQAGQDKSPDYAQPGIGVIGQDALTVKGKLTISDPDTGESVFDPNGGTFSYSGKYGHLMLLSDGRWSYGVAAGTHDWYRGNVKTNVGSAIDQLGQGETLTDTITVHSKDGTTHDIVITIHGDNDAPYVSSEVALHSGKEDVSQTFTKAELLTNAVDVDNNDSGLMTVANLLADHGSIRDNHDGTYTYTPELNYHGKVHFSYDINDAHGGSTPTGASFDLASANDASVLAAGQESGTVTEDHLRSGTTGQLWSGWTNLDVTDVDGASEAEIAFIEVNGVQHAVPADFAMSLTGNHGYFSTTHSTDGHNKWSYTADNTSSEIQGLKTGQQLQDTMVLITKDGTRIPVTATIQGQDDHVIIDTPDALTAAIGTAVEDIKTTVVGMLQAHDLDKGDDVSFELAGSASSQAGSYGTFYVDRSGHWHYDLDASKVDSLRSGDGKAEAFNIVAISSDGSRATQKVEILVQGTDDAAIITGQSTGSVTEDVHVQGDARHTVFTGGVLNVKDPDIGQRGFHHTLNAHAISDPYGGSLSIDKAGGWIYSVPNGNLQHLAQGETEHVQYQVQTLGGDTHVITVDIVGTNDKPTLTAQTQTVNEDGSLLNGQMQGSDTDHGATLTYSIAQSVDGLIFNADGSYTFDPTNASYDHLAKGQTQTLTIPVTVTDEHGAGTTQNLEIVITGSNDAAKVSGVDTGDVRENQAGQDMSPDYAQPGMSKISHDALYASGQLSIVDPDTDEAKFDTKGGIYSYHGQYGHLLLREDGHWDYKVAAGQTDWLRQGASTTVGTTIDKLGAGETLTDTITIQTKDGTSHDIVITIHGDNDAPYVSGEVLLHTGKEDLPQIITSAELLANSIDVDHNDQGQLTIANLVADHGSILDNQDGTYTFTPDRDYNGQVHFNYDVVDAHGGTTHTGATTTLAAVDDKTTISSVDHGVATEDVATHMSTNVNIMDAVDWQALQITDVDSPNTQVKVEFAGQQYTWDLGSDLDVTTPYGKFQFHTLVSGPHAGEHSWSYIGDNSNVHVQELKHGESLTESIKLIATDGTEFPITVQVSGTEDGVVIDSKSELGHVVENAQTGASVAGTVTAHDTDLHDSVSWTATPAGGVSGQYGSFHLSADGQWHYDVDQSKATKLGDGDEYWEHFTIEAVSTDGSKVSQSVSVVVRGNNDAPVVSGEVTLPSSKEDSSIHITQAQLIANATDVDSNDRGWLHVQNITADHGSITSNSDGSFTFAPDPNYNGLVHFTYDIADKHGGITHTGANATLVAVNDNATFTGDSANLVEDTNLQHNSRIAGSTTIQDALLCRGSLVISDVDGQGEAALDLKGQQQISQDGTYGHFLIKPDGTWVYTADNSDSNIQDLDNGQTLTDSIEITSIDGTKHSISVTISGSTDKPTIHSFTDSGVQNTGPIEGNLISGVGTSQGTAAAATDSDSNAHLVLQDIQIKDPVSGNYVAVTPGHPHAIAGIGTLAIEANGHYIFTPEAGFTGKVPSMVYRVGDDGGTPVNDSSQNTLSIEVKPPVQHAPTVTPQTVTSDEDQSHIFTVAEFGYQDADHDALNHITITQLPSHGLLTLNGVVVTANQQVSKADLDAGHLAFTPIHNQSGANYAHFEFRANDGHQDSTSVSMSIDVNAINDAPVLHITPVTPITGQLTNTDPDIGDVHHYSVASSIGRFGQLTLDPDTGDYKYVPSGQLLGMQYHSSGNQYTAKDTFEVTVTDGAGATSTRYMTFDLNGNMTAPTIQGQRPGISVHVTGLPTVTTTMPSHGSSVSQPANRVSIDLVAASDSGQSHTDNVTNQTTPTIAGHTDIPFSEVKLYDGAHAVGSGYSDAQGNYQISTTALTNGVHNLSARALAPNDLVPAVSTLLPVRIDTQPPRPALTVETIATDDVINAHESQGTVTITGSVSGDAQQGDVVTLRVAGHSYSGTVDGSHHYHVDVPGSELAQTTTVHASITSSDLAGNVGTASVDHHIDVDTTVASPSISFESPGPDKLYSKAEIARGAAGTVTATVHAAADAKVGEHLNINGVDHVLDANAIQHGIQLEVAPNTVVKAVMTDEHGNVNSALNVSAGAKPEPIVVTAPSGSHHISANLGVPTLMPSQTPVPTSQQGWKILVGGHYQTSYTSQWGTLSIDPQTGHLSYQEHANVHTGPHGSAQNVGVHEDHFQIALQGSHHDDVVLHVQVSILSHGPGHSGKLTLGSEVLDMTVTPVLPHTSPPPPPPPPKDAYDEPEPDLLNENPHELTIMAELGIGHHKDGDDTPIEKHTAASTYMEQLGIGKQDAHTDSSSTDLPDDIDIVFNDADQHDTKFDHHEDASHHGEHSGLEHLQDTGSEHHDVDDPTLPDDPTR
ncbi:VCBS domain-containing protein [Vibrio maritimus]|uniref:VCBS domain-containing protein n=1 Tax=Vibrio maritimus TaxID=990268 RepID=UPI001F28EA89|nr:VCBS domain-containing protein [Vibrio maritimus]